MNINISSTLSVSRQERLNCEKMAEFLGKQGILTLVKSNISTLPRKEYGCQLTQSIHSKDEIKYIWEAVRDKYGLNCAHLSIGNSFDGCILDYLAETRCKGN